MERDLLGLAFVFSRPWIIESVVDACFSNEMMSEVVQSSISTI